MSFHKKRILSLINCSSSNRSKGDDSEEEGLWGSVFRLQSYRLLRIRSPLIYPYSFVFFFDYKSNELLIHCCSLAKEIEDVNHVSIRIISSGSGYIKWLNPISVVYPTRYSQYKETHVQQIHQLDHCKWNDSDPLHLQWNERTRKHSHLEEKDTEHINWKRRLDLSTLPTSRHQGYSYTFKITFKKKHSQFPNRIKKKTFDRAHIDVVRLLRHSVP